ncbi:MAG: ParA family protein [Bacteroidota bacterium]
MAFTIVMGRVKGGVGSSTTSVNLAVYFANKGYRTTILDCDINQSCKVFVEARSADLPEVRVVGMRDIKKLVRTVNSLKEQSDILLIDGSPTLAEKTSYLILLADIILIPTPADMFSIAAQELFVERYLEAKALKSDEIPAYFLMSMYNPRINLHKEFKNVLKGFLEYDIGTLKSFLQYRTAYRTSLIEGRGAYEWRDAKAKQEVESLGKEVLQIGKAYQYL